MPRPSQHGERIKRQDPKITRSVTMQKVIKTRTSPPSQPRHRRDQERTSFLAPRASYSERKDLIIAPTSAPTRAKHFNCVMRPSCTQVLDKICPPLPPANLLQQGIHIL